MSLPKWVITRVTTVCKQEKGAYKPAKDIQDKIPEKVKEINEKAKVITDRHIYQSDTRSTKRN